ncbi:uncharacterized protein HKW66_Vig0145330 [Vigna angularis]|uniref:Uncharacterized protein n=1 Tax=Phaseolus angularis TaxID=3914 RepID=A0A8T0KCH9_PHAAN|nr:uncharacterized protein HKW66_Vig0145330 [Vigna angularis]
MHTKLPQTNSREGGSLQSIFPLSHLPCPSSRSSAVTNGGLSTVIAKPNGYSSEFAAEEVGDLFLAAKDLRWGSKEVEKVEASGSGGSGNGRDGRALAAVAEKAAVLVAFVGVTTVALPFIIAPLTKFERWIVGIGLLLASHS